MEERSFRTRVIVVSGSHRGSGKTRLIEKLLPLLGTAAAVKITGPHDGGRESADGDGSDTSRYLAAGASDARLLTGSDEDVLQEVWFLVGSGRFETVCVETNRLMGKIQADLRFFVKGSGESKQNAALCEAQADLVVFASKAPAKSLEASGGHT